MVIDFMLKRTISFVWVNLAANCLEPNVNFIADHKGGSDHGGYKYCIRYTENGFSRKQFKLVLFNLACCQSR